MQDWHAINQFKPHLPSDLQPFGECPFQAVTSSFRFAVVNLYISLYGWCLEGTYATCKFNSPLIEVATHIRPVQVHWYKVVAVTFDCSKTNHTHSTRRFPKTLQNKTFYFTIKCYLYTDKMLGVRQWRTFKINCF